MNLKRINQKIYIGKKVNQKAKMLVPVRYKT